METLGKAGMQNMVGALQGLDTPPFPEDCNHMNSSFRVVENRLETIHPSQLKQLEEKLD